MFEVTRGYLYSRYKGRFEVHYGTITPLNYGRRRDYARFEYTNGQKEKRLQCWYKPGVVYYGTVWLTERDDELARKLFLDYEKNCILELEERIDRHHGCIETLLVQEVNDDQLSNM